MSCSRASVPFPARLWRTRSPPCWNASRTGKLSLRKLPHQFGGCCAIVFRRMRVYGCKISQTPVEPSRMHSRGGTAGKSLRSEQRRWRRWPLALLCGREASHTYLMRSPSRREFKCWLYCPWKNLSRDSDQEYFADGMTEALINELGKISKPRVISRQSVMQYKGSHKSLPEIARELKADAILGGAVERSGDRVRINVHLEQAYPERQLWTKQYDRSIRDVLTLQDEIARTAADEIQAKLTPEERTRLAVGHPVDPEAQDNYLRGLYFSRKFSEQDFQRAISLFKAAIAKDPTYAPAYTELANIYLGWGSADHGGPSAMETMPLARAAVT